METISQNECQGLDSPDGIGVVLAEDLLHGEHDVLLDRHQDRSVSS